MHYYYILKLFQNGFGHTSETRQQHMLFSFSHTIKRLGFVLNSFLTLLQPKFYCTEHKYHVDKLLELIDSFFFSMVIFFCKDK